jgi:hypothetical protein
MAFELKFQRTALSLDFLRAAGDLKKVPSMAPVEGIPLFQWKEGSQAEIPCA